ncbi:GAF domain-containing protein [Frigidibacter sp. SD6-1]|uniref:GAF domain-containing protein n=1 Tax=Frigidibacter sp. SD6-1 TaxID=3032581 RepID=UPI0032E80291
MQTANTPTVDLTNCDREAIHLLGRVQSYGALLGLSSDWIVQQASANLDRILGVPAAEALGQPLSELVVSEGYDRIRQSLRFVTEGDVAIRIFGVVLKSNGAAYDVSLHQSGAHMTVEFEPKGARAGHDLMGEVYQQIAGLRDMGDLESLASRAAEALRALSGFDSVMVYHFQPDHSGRVIAEIRADGRSVYNGMMFPATDIPVQARALYKRSLLRLIADVNDAGNVIQPGVDMAGRPVDLSLAVTRAVSPIHIEYLRNMGVEASMSVSIMKDGELWGLFWYRS